MKQQKLRPEWLRRWILFLSCFAVVVSSSSCSVNILESFANKNSDEALYNDALTAMNQNDYPTALAKVAAMSSAYQGLPKVIQLQASADGGLCGFTFLTFAQALAGIGSTRLFPFLLSQFTSATTTTIDYCKAAQNLIVSIPASERTPDQNMFLALISFAKIGNILNFYADSAPRNGVADTSYDPCNNPGAGAPRTAGASIPDSDVAEIGTGIAFAIQSLGAVAANANLGQGSLSSINTVCSVLPGNYNFCNITDPTAFTTNELKGIRTMMNEDQTVGLGSNCSGSVVTCVCL